ncbi:putative isoamyl alcohol oxidase [Rosellinia necatrix]|uniref:Putative isoamyl alcohol oxidase n=1 Tax=Rosellinia necatrix TaxID=77044 RepID=A0A1W2TG64_ROSNE|nr:putative isoamyl alcohol oxidase [Rosellinia necatrix]
MFRLEWLVRNVPKSLARTGDHTGFVATRMALALFTPLVALAWLPWAAATPCSACKCTPSMNCWPTAQQWTDFNTSVSGKLIRTAPVMLPCYGGPDYDSETCQQLDSTLWWDPKWQAQQPVGYDYPLNEECPPPGTFGNVSAAHCQLGNSPMYAINATTEEDIVKGIQFAKKQNLRVVIKSSGHDFLQRSKGFYGLSIWLYNFRDGYQFHDNNPVQKDCPASTWDKSTLTITGAYAWSDVYPTSWEKKTIVVGGNQNGPCSTGGWTQGGGHSPVTRDFGMGGDQVLSARIVLASGEIVTASPCENPDLFFAVRGGGPGTYGVVTSITVKTYPTTNVNLFYVVLGSQGDDTVPQFLDAISTMYTSLPGLSKLGFGGYGYWVAHSASGLGGHHFQNVWYQAFTITGKTTEEAQGLFQSFEDKITAFNTSSQGIQVNITKTAYATYGDYFQAKVGTNALVGGVSALSSHFLDSNGLAGNSTRLRLALDTISGEPGKPVYHTLVHHGLEATDGLQVKDSAVNPSWYNSILLDIFERDVVNTVVADNTEPFAYIRDTVYPVYKGLSPSVGTYMNEADWGNPNWQNDFYDIHWDRLSEVKSKYDPTGLFYCITCVGSESWEVKDDGSLCKKA